MDNTIIIAGALVLIVAIIMFSGVPELLIFSRIVKSIMQKSETEKKKVTLKEIDEMSGTDFEKFCVELLQRNGFAQVEHTGKSGDQGADIIAYKDDKKYVIQCKRYSRKLNNHAIQQAHTGKTIHGCDVAMVITNNYFTAGAIEAAKATDVILWDRKRLKEMLDV